MWLHGVNHHLHAFTPKCHFMLLRGGGGGGRGRGRERGKAKEGRGQNGLLTSTILRMSVHFPAHFLVNSATCTHSKHYLLTHSLSLPPSLPPSHLLLLLVNVFKQGDTVGALQSILCQQCVLELRNTQAMNITLGLGLGPRLETRHMHMMCVWMVFALYRVSWGALDHRLQPLDLCPQLPNQLHVLILHINNNNNNSDNPSDCCLGSINSLH